MTIQIAILGLGHIGASIGLALATQKEQIQRIGWDCSPDTAQKALGIGAVDRGCADLAAAVQDADVVTLALPVGDIRPTLELIASVLKPDCVVLDTSPAAAAVSTWAHQLLPGSCDFVGFTPTLNPIYLQESDGGIDAARDDFFQSSLMVLTHPPGTPSEAVRLAHNLALLLGASSLYTDTLESGGLLASSDLLPKLAAAALLNATVDQPGWQDARKIASRAYAAATAAVMHLDDDEQPGWSALLNRENALRVIDNLMAALHRLRAAIADDDQQTLHTLL
ncbi:MAG: prephenate dehydrogenase/arogenate dehydrogenase family protein, partial [Anaerolineaceae bacterium]|nr:prephenate dehydrogenase/arogenate dehydrogenase family protein [Anaerolineaceae bacterium]